MSSKKPVKKQPRKQVSSWVIFFISLAIIVALVAVIKFTGNPKPIVPDQPTVFTPTHRAEIVLEDYGTIKLDLDGNAAPITVANFAELSNSGFYDGLAFHRIIEGFMIQAGDPYSRDTSLVNMWGQGGPDYTVPAEFVPDYRHKKGALAAARKGDMANPKKASSGSQFYIVHDENSCVHLDGQYSVFGEVVEGLEVIDIIATVPVDRMDRPYEDVVIITVRPVVQKPEVVTPADSSITADPNKE